MDTETTYDVIVVGGGPAGLSAALLLARCRRRVLVCDAGNPRNAKSNGIHGFLTRNDVNPSEFHKAAVAEVIGYGAEVCDATVMSVCERDGAFDVRLLDETVLRARKVLLATGVVDKLPDIEGIMEFYGKSVHHCPYCDGWEHRDEPLAVYGNSTGGTALSLAMKTWSQDVVLLTNGPARLKAREKEQLVRFGITVYEKRIRRLEGIDGMLRRIFFEDGQSIDRTAIFFSTGNVQRSALPVDLGCALTPKGAVRTTRGQHTSIRGIYVAGDAAKDVQYVVVAAAEGAKAGMAINKELQEEDQAFPSQEPAEALTELPGRVPSD